jgi:hypothetical protein
MVVYRLSTTALHLLAGLLLIPSFVPEEDEEDIFQ